MENKLYQPILKSVKKSLFNNYRPISILSSILKIFQSLVCECLLGTLRDYIIHQQKGFFSHRPLEFNLLTFINIHLEALEDGYQVRAANL